MYAYKVTYNQKNMDVNSKAYGILSDKSRKFASLQDAFKYVRELKSKKEIVGMPVIESI
jgi:hypothetical protein